MAKIVHGYVRNISTGDGVSGRDVEIRSAISPFPLITSSAGSGNVVSGDEMTPSTMTTESDGSFTWEKELSPGPITAEVTVVEGVETKIRSGDEQFQIGGLFSSDLSEFAKIFSDGVMSGRLEELSVSAVPGLSRVEIRPGRAVVDGYVWTIDTPIVLSIDAYNGITERWDLVVLRQHTSGDYVGKQEVVVVKGQANQIDPLVNQLDYATDLVLARARKTNSGTVSAVNDLRTYASVVYGDNTIAAENLTAGGSVSGSDAKVLKAPSSGNTPLWNTLTLGELSGVAETTPTTGQVLTYNGTAWTPTTPATASTSHTHAYEQKTNAGALAPSQVGYYDLNCTSGYSLMSMSLVGPAAGAGTVMSECWGLDSDSGRCRVINLDESTQTITVQAICAKLSY